MLLIGLNKFIYYVLAQSYIKILFKNFQYFDLQVQILSNNKTIL